MFGPTPPTFEVVKKVGSIGSKSRSSRMRSINTEPTMPRQPMNPTVLMFVIPARAGIQEIEGKRMSLERLDHRRTHLGSGHRFRLGRRDVCRAKPGGERSAHRL